MDGVLVEEGDHVPHDETVRGLEEEGALADGELGWILLGIGSGICEGGLDGIPWALSRRTWGGKVESILLFEMGRVPE